MLEVNHIELNDRKALRSLLEIENLCFNDISNVGVYIFEVRLKQHIIGYFGYEIFGNTALFRSMVIIPEYRKKGYGILMWNEALKKMRVEKIAIVYLLTNSAAPFFKRLGFEEVARSSAPPDIASTSEFIEFCPSDSVCMKINLTKNE